MINKEAIKKLREQTKAKMLDCQKALIQANGEYETAILILKESAIETAKKKTYRLTKSGIIGHYIHNNQQLAALVEIHCETEVAASTPIFKDFVHDIATHIAAAAPKYITSAEIPVDEISQLTSDELKNFYKSCCLMEQEYYKDSSKSIQEIFLEFIAVLRENVEVKKFVRIEVKK